MKTAYLPWTVFFACLATLVSAQESPLERADALYEEGNYALARERYREALEATEEPERRAYLDIRILDCSWRNDARQQRRYWGSSVSLDDIGLQLKRMIDSESQPPLSLENKVEASYSLALLLNYQNRHKEAQERFFAAHESLLKAGRFGEASALLARLVSEYTADFQAAHRGWGQSLLWATLPLIDSALLHASSEQTPALLFHRVLVEGNASPASLSTKSTLEAIVASEAEGSWKDDALERLAQICQHGWREHNAVRRDRARAERLYLEAIAHASSEVRRNHLRARLREIRKPTLSLTLPTSHLVGSEILAEVQASDIDSFALSIQKFDFAAHWDDPSAIFALRGTDLGASPPKETVKLVEIAQEEVFDSHSFKIPLPADLEAGTYAIAAEASEDLSESSLIDVSDYTGALHSLPNRVHCLISHAVTHEPLAGTEVRLYGKHSVNRAEFLGTASTDAHGIAEFALPSQRQLVAVFRTPDGFGRTAFTNNGYLNEGTPFRFFLQTDKPAYRPGETVNFLLTARAYQDRTYSVPEQKDLFLRIESENDDVIFEQAIQLDNSGRYASEIVLGEEAALGEYYVTIAQPDSDSHFEYEPFFHVEEYRLPEWEAVIAFPEETQSKAIRPGDIIDVEVRAFYLSGTPVSGATVDLSVSAGSFERNFELQTSNLGVAKQSIQIPVDVGNEFSLDFHAEVTTRSNRARKASAALEVSRLPGKVTLPRESAFVEVGSPFSLPLSSATATGQPVSLSGNLLVARMEKLIRLTDEDQRFSYITIGEWQRRFSQNRDFVLDEKIASAQLEERRAAVEQLAWQTSEDGTGTLQFTAKTPGRYRLVLMGAGEFYDDTFAEFELWVHPKPGDHREVPWTDTIQIIPQMEDASVGQRIDYLIALPYAGCPFVQAYSHGDHGSCQAIRPQGAFALQSVEIDLQHAPRLTASAYGRVMGASASSEVSHAITIPDRQLSIEIEFDRSTYEPQESGYVEVRVADLQGQPVETDLTFALTDDSIYQLYDDNVADLYRFFYREDFGGYFSSARSHSPTSRYSRISRNGAWVDLWSLWRHGHRNGPQLRYQGEGMELIGGHGSYDDAIFELSPFMVESADENGYRATQVLAGTRLRAVLQDVGSSVSLLSEEFLRAIATGEKGELLNQLAGEAPGDLPRRSALRRILKHAGDRVLVRHDFRSTLLWEPIVRTNRQGIARIPVTFGDKIGAWRATARIISQDTQVGSRQEKVTTVKTVVNRIQAPRFLMQGDAARIAATLSNTGDENLRLDAAFTLEGLDFDEAQSESGAGYLERPRVLVPASDEREFRLPVKAKEPGEATIRFFSGNRTRFDAVKQSLPIYEWGMPQSVHRNYDLSAERNRFPIEIPSDFREGTLKVTVNISSGYIPLLLDALPYLIDYPYGCTEQTLSRFVPLVVAMKTLEQLGLDAEAAMARINAAREAGGIKVPSKEKQNPVTLLDGLVKKGLERLESHQRADGAWGWWPGGTADPHLTAYAVYALALAEDAGVDISDINTSGAVAFLDQRLRSSTNPDLNDTAWILHALAHTPEAVQLRESLRAKARLLEANLQSLSVYGQARYFQKLWIGTVL